MQREALFERSTHSGTDDIVTIVRSQIAVIDVFRNFLFRRSVWSNLGAGL